MKKRLLVLAVVSMVGMAWGQADPAKPKAFNLEATLLGNSTVTTSSTSMLLLSVQDVAPKSGVCPYYVKSFVYDSNTKRIDVRVYHDNCRNEAFGTSTGKAFWIVPHSVLKKGARLTVSVNETNAGALVFDENTGNFIVESL